MVYFRNLATAKNSKVMLNISRKLLFSLDFINGTLYGDMVYFLTLDTAKNSHKNK